MVRKKKAVTSKKSPSRKKQSSGLMPISIPSEGNIRGDIIPVEAIAGQILTLRSQRVILDSDLAKLYGV